MQRAGATKQNPIPPKPNLPPITISIATASALFNMSDAEFTMRFIGSGLLRLNRLHQLDMGAVLHIYEKWPQPKRPQFYSVADAILDRMYA